MKGLIKSKRQWLLFFSITALGISSITTQIIVIREFLTVFHGNELVFGIILANWLFITGMGAYLGRYFKRKKLGINLLIVLQIVIAFLPFFYIWIIRNLRNFIFLPGELIGLSKIFLSSLFILFPYCLISGFLLNLVCSIFSKKEESRNIGKVYFIDNIGDILGGLLFSFVFIYFLNHYQTIFFLMLINLAAAFSLGLFVRNKIFLYTIVLLFIIGTVFFFSFDLDKITKEQQYKNQELLEQKSTPYGDIVITKTAEQLNFYENGLILFTTENTIANEETVHYAMVQSINPKNVLLISGGISGTIKEILKYNVSSIDYVELDPYLISIGRRYTNNLENNKVRIINQDGRLFVRRTEKKYDVIIIDLPDPSTAQINRFYTKEFFKEAKKILEKNGVISLSLSAYGNYLNKETKRMYSVIYKTMRDSFNNVIIIPGERSYFIASDSKLSYNISGLVGKRGIRTSYVNSFYLKGKLTEERIKYLMGSLKRDVEVNRDFTPIAYYYYLLYWIQHFRFNFTLFFVILGAVILIYLLRTSSVSFAISTIGFSASSLEVLILIGFQVLYGYAYHKISIIITSFMIGLALGSYYANKHIDKIGKKEFMRLLLSLAFYSTILPLLLFFMNKIHNIVLLSISSQLILPIFMIIIAYLTGMAFPLASKLSSKQEVRKIAAELYSADLFGACIGALLSSSFLIPILGIFRVSLLIAGINIISWLVLWYRQ